MLLVFSITCFCVTYKYIFDWLSVRTTTTTTFYRSVKKSTICQLGRKMIYFDEDSLSSRTYNIGPHSSICRPWLAQYISILFNIFNHCLSVSVVFLSTCLHVLSAACWLVHTAAQVSVMIFQEAEQVNLTYSREQSLPYNKHEATLSDNLKVFLQRG